MKGYYITNLNLNEQSGVSKKIDMQISAIKSLGHEIELISYFKRYRLRKLKALTTRLPFFPLSSRWKYKNFYKGADFFYIRYPLADKWLIRFFKKLKKENPNSKLIIEVATFPYDGEAKSISKKMRFAKDKVYRTKMKEYVDFIVTSSKYNTIYGVPTVNIHNGFDVDQVPIANSEKEDENITLATVSSLSFWQGFDRVIEGLYKYNQQGNNNVRFLIIGEGGERDRLYKLADKYGLIDSETVIFTGELHGKELDLMFDKIDIGIGCLGLHRKNMSYVNTLKVREYCARGIPFIIANEEGGINESKSFVCRVSSDDSPININKIIDFYHSVSEKKDFREELRNYAKLNLTWKAQMDKVMKKI
ncbi:glycosyltransferase [Salinicoccus sp. RF5]|uniref:glycosyltransferase n=1 Tax=Salinicoccus sp. RF5 TaxID=2748874 RepID=UPI001E4B59BA|nr:glycosyltransferase [Salinicoccus sp. RF5]MCC4722352.1 glycosyltransferase [Salinicoccus sp. RF5]